MERSLGEGGVRMERSLDGGEEGGVQVERSLFTGIFLGEDLLLLHVLLRVSPVKISDCTPTGQFDDQQVTQWIDAVEVVARFIKFKSVTMLSSTSASTRGPQRGRDACCVASRRCGSIRRSR